MQWLHDLPWAEVGVFTGGCTITVPQSGTEGFERAGMLCLWLWEEGFHDLSLKLHYVVIQMLCAPVQTTITHPTLSRVFAQRVERFFDGDWRQLYYEARNPVHRPEHVDTAEDFHRKQGRRAEHLAMNGQFREAIQSL